MKKALSLVLALALTAGCTISATAEVKKRVYGDINGDGKTDVTDISLAAAYIKGKKPLIEEQLFLGDLNYDEKLNVTDLAKLASYVKCVSTNDDIISKIEGFIKDNDLPAVVYIGEDEITGKFAVTVLINSISLDPEIDRSKYNAEVIERIKAFANKNSYDPEKIQFITAE